MPPLPPPPPPPPNLPLHPTHPSHLPTQPSDTDEWLCVSILYTLVSNWLLFVLWFVVDVVCGCDGSFVEVLFVGVVMVDFNWFRFFSSLFSF